MPSDSIEKTKKYLNKLRMETNESIVKISRKILVQLIKEELEVILTDAEVKEMFDINMSEETTLSEAPLVQTEPVPALQRPEKKWPAALLKHLGILEQRIKAIETKLWPPGEER